MPRIGVLFGLPSFCVICPDLKIAIVLLTNEAEQTAQGGLEEIADKVLKLFSNYKIAKMKAGN